MSSPTSQLFARLAEYGDAPALIFQGTTWTYTELLEHVTRWRDRLVGEGVRRGDAVAFFGDYSPDTTALLLALIQGEQIAVPLTKSSVPRCDALVRAAHVSATIDLTSEGGYRVQRREAEPHPLFTRLDGAGLVVFTTGSTAESKAVLHAFDRLLAKYDERRPARRSLVFLLLDHLGGINTLLHVLSNGGTAVTTASRTPDAVCKAIAEHRVELLPTSPTFLNMLLMSKAYEAHDLSSLEQITFGTEPMPEATLRKLRERFPRVTAKQTYGLTELGVFPTRSRGDGSLWLELSGPHVEMKVRDGTLRLRSSMAMLGYLNAADPFDTDGWFDTQDEVETDGDFLRILGRRSDVINVGGEKVYPAAVENVLLGMENVADVEIYGRPNAATGKVVAARVVLLRPEPCDELRARVRAHCAGKLKRYEIPLWVEVADEAVMSARFKKLRRA